MLFIGFLCVLLQIAVLVFSSPIDTGSPQIPLDEWYEYIVVGSGAGGGPLAARLALAGKKVLLIEAGDDQGSNRNQTVPVLHAHSAEDPSMSWDFYVKHYATEDRAKADSKMTWETPSKETYVGMTPPTGSKQKGILYPRSGTLGGCTTHNAMVAVYPHDSDWSHIVNITGDKSWEPASMRKMFERMENLEYGRKDIPGHGYKGWFSISMPPPTMAAGDEALLTVGVTAANFISRNEAESAVNLQRTFDGDMNSPLPERDSSEGIWLIPLSVKTPTPDNPGVRVGSRDFIMSVHNAKTESGAKKYQLDIALDTFVHRVNFATSTGGAKPKAVGVRYSKGKYQYKASPRSPQSKVSTETGDLYASKEVIIAGGAYNSPQILKLSGVGPKEELYKFGIPVIADLPGVGTNLQDHFEISTTHTKADKFEISVKCTYGEAGDPCMEEYKKGEGFYGATNGFVYGVIKKSSVAHKDVVYGNDPDLFLFGGPAAFRGYYPGYARDVYGHNDWTWVVLKAHTANRAGTVKLRSADPLDTPEIVFNYFDTGDKDAAARDLKAMSEGIETAREIQDKVVLAKSPTPIFKEVLPGLQFAANSTALTDHIKAESWSHHASCTCPIGSADDPMAVLDSKFRVRGVSGLRVVDASVFPRIPGFFVAVPTYMISEKAAESILTGN